MRVSRHLKADFGLLSFIWATICVLILVITEAVALVPTLGTLATAGWMEALQCFVRFNAVGLIIGCVVSGLFWSGPFFSYLRILFSGPADHRYSSRAVQDSLPEELQSFLSKISEIAGGAERRVIPEFATGDMETLNIVDKVEELNKEECESHQHDCSQHAGEAHKGPRRYHCSMQIPAEVWREAAERKDEQLKLLYQRSQSLPAAEYMIALSEVAKGYSNITLGRTGDAGPYRMKSFPYCDEVLQKIDSANDIAWSDRLFVLYDLATICAAGEQHAMACSFYEKLVPIARERLQDKAVIGSILSNYSAEARAAKNNELAACLKKEASSFLARAEQRFFDDYVVPA